MHADMNAVMVGYYGMRDMIDAIFGNHAQPSPQPIVPVAQVVNQSSENLPKLTPEAFDRMFADHKGKPN